MNEDKLKKDLQDAFGVAETKPRPFRETWAAAEARHARVAFRWKAAACVAAAAVLAAIVLTPGEQPELSDDYMIADALMNSTTWTAPSDVLMPDHQFDIYREVPLPNPSTISEEGSLL